MINLFFFLRSEEDECHSSLQTNNIFTALSQIQVLLVAYNIETLVKSTLREHLMQKTKNIPPDSPVAQVNFPEAELIEQCAQPEGVKHEIPGETISIERDIDAINFVTSSDGKNEKEGFVLKLDDTSEELQSFLQESVKQEACDKVGISQNSDELCDTVEVSQNRDATNSIIFPDPCVEEETLKPEKGPNKLDDNDQNLSCKQIKSSEVRKKHLAKINKNKSTHIKNKNIKARRKSPKTHKKHRLVKKAVKKLFRPERTSDVHQTGENVESNLADGKVPNQPTNTESQSKSTDLEGQTITENQKTVNKLEKKRTKNAKRRSENSEERVTCKVCGKTYKYVP